MTDSALPLSAKRVQCGEVARMGRPKKNGVLGLTLSERRLGILQCLRHQHAEPLQWISALAAAGVLSALAAAAAAGYGRAAAATTCVVSLLAQSSQEGKILFQAVLIVVAASYALLTLLLLLLRCCLPGPWAVA